MNYIPSSTTTTTITLFILLGILHTVSHPQYYPNNEDDYDDEYEAGSSPPYYHESPSSTTPIRKRADNNGYFSARNLQPSFRQYQYHRHYLNEPVATTVRYFGTGPHLPPFETTDTSNNDEIFMTQQQSYQPAATLEKYRRRYKTPLLTETSAETSVPVQSHNEFSSPHFDIQVVVRDPGQMSITVSSNPPNQERNHFVNPSYSPESRNPEPTGRRDSSGERLPPDTLHRACNIGERISRTDGRCYTLGTGVGCPRTLMVFYAEDDNDLYGYCDCAIDNTVVARPLAYWRPHDRCYLLYTRGPCLYNEWLILDRNDIPHCAPRSCPLAEDESGLSQEFWLLYQGKCYKTGEYYVSLCSVDQSGYKVYFDLLTSKPECMLSPPRPLSISGKGILGPVGDLRCKPGYKKVQTGECKKIRKFESDYNYY